jgi:hypothetical protein
MKPRVSVLELWSLQPNSGSDGSEVFWKSLEVRHKIHSDESLKADPVQLRAKAMHTGRYLATPASRDIADWVRECSLGPRSEVSHSTTTVKEVEFKFRRLFLSALVVVVREQPFPRIPHDCKFIIRIKHGGSEFSPVAGKILMILPVHAKGAVNTVACGFGDMNRNTAIQVGDHRYHAHRRLRARLGCSDTAESLKFVIDTNVPFISAFLTLKKAGTAPPFRWYLRL